MKDIDKTPCKNIAGEAAEGIKCYCRQCVKAAQLWKAGGEFLAVSFGLAKIKERANLLYDDKAFHSVLKHISKHRGEL